MICDLCSTNTETTCSINYSCGHMFHKSCLLPHEISLLNPMCKKCSIGKLSGYESDKYESDDDDDDDDDSYEKFYNDYDDDDVDDHNDDDKNDHNDHKNDNNADKHYAHITTLHVSMLVVSAIGLFIGIFS